MTVNHEALLWAFIIVVVVVSVLVSGSRAFAIPHVYISSTGDDANDGLSKQTAIRTLERATELGVMGSDTGLKWDKDDTPVGDISFFKKVHRSKPDRVEVIPTAQLISGRSEQATSFDYDSVDAGFIYRYRFVWEVRNNANGPQAVCVDVIEELIAR